MYWPHMSLQADNSYFRETRKSLAHHNRMKPWGPLYDFGHAKYFIQCESEGPFVQNKANPFIDSLQNFNTKDSCTLVRFKSHPKQPDRAESLVRGQMKVILASHESLIDTAVHFATACKLSLSG